MPKTSPARAWVENLPAKTFFSVRDVPGTARAAESALSRLAGAGTVARVKPGLYWKAPPPTRFGVLQPSPRDAAYFAAGRGSGPAELSAANALGFTTQVPFKEQVAVVGRAPKGVKGVKFQARANHRRYDLNSTEIAVLEALRLPASVYEVPWEAAAERIRGLAETGKVRLHALQAAAAHEHSVTVRERIASLA